MLIHWIWLAQLPKLSPWQKTELLKIFCDAEDIYAAEPAALCGIAGITEKYLDALSDKNLTEADRILQECLNKRISIVTYGDTSYPLKLKNIEDPPLVLYYKGTLPDWDSVPVIGVVGTRKASAYGLQVAREMGQQIARCGARVASGGADGIDREAMMGALTAHREVVAVLGCGADVVYPAKNRQLFEDVEKQGCLLTEYPPGTPPYAWNFPRRNRIVSGLSSGILVVEAPEKSGALITANCAMEQGRDVFVIPGNINTPCCAGSNQLLRDGAIPVFTGWDVVREYECLYPGKIKPAEHTSFAQIQVAQEPVYPKAQANRNNKSIDNREKSRYSVLNSGKVDLTEEEQTVISVLSDRPCPVDDVIAQCSLPAGKVLSILTLLALKGAVKNHPGKYVSLN